MLSVPISFCIAVVNSLKDQRSRFLVSSVKAVFAFVSYTLVLKNNPIEIVNMVAINGI